MSRYFSDRLSGLNEYVPGEQPKDRKYIKLNTNESPFAPSEGVEKAVNNSVRDLNLYSDPDSTKLTDTVAEYLRVSSDCVLMTNGSDEILNFAFAAFGDDNNSFSFPDITYGFYPVFGKLNCVKCNIVKLKDDFSVDVNDYINIGTNLVLANPNAPTGLILSTKDIEKILVSNKNHVVIIDEAYIDFGGESCVKLIDKYDNLLVTRTFSKSFSLAGARLGFGVGAKSLIDDLKKVKNSINPYNVNTLTSNAGIAAIRDAEYYMANCRTVIETREKYKSILKDRGFTLTDSKSNFIFAANKDISGEKLYLLLKDKGILVRHFKKERIENYVRITVGTELQMEALVKAIDEIIRR